MNILIDYMIYNLYKYYTLLCTLHIENNYHYTLNYVHNKTEINNS